MLLKICLHITQNNSFLSNYFPSELKSHSMLREGFVEKYFDVIAADQIREIISLDNFVNFDDMF